MAYKKLISGNILIMTVAFFHPPPPPHILSLEESLLESLMEVDIRFEDRAAAKDSVVDSAAAAYLVDSRCCIDDCRLAE